MKSTTKDIQDAIGILTERLKAGGHTMATWCLAGTAVDKLQNAIRYLQAQMCSKEVR